MFEYKVVELRLADEYDVKKLERVLTKNSKEGCVNDIIKLGKKITKR